MKKSRVLKELLTITDEFFICKNGGILFGATNSIGIDDENLYIRKYDIELKFSEVEGFSYDKRQNTFSIETETEIRTFKLINIEAK